MPVVVDTPVPFGPRNCDQSSDAMVIENEMIMRARIKDRFRFIVRTDYSESV